MSEGRSSQTAVTVAPDTRFDAIEYRRFIEQIFRAPSPLVLTCIPDGRPPTSLVLDKGNIDKSLDWAIRHNRDANLYFQIGAPTEEAVRLIEGGLKRKLATQDIEAISYLWVDLDPPSTGDVNEWRERTLSALRSFELPPSIILHSGGGLWAYWRLTNAVVLRGNAETAEHIECCNRGLAEVLGGDHATDVARLSRLPGSVNWPNAKKRSIGRNSATARVIEWEAARAYDLKSFDQYAELGSRDSCPGPGNTRRGTSKKKLQTIDDLHKIPELQGEYNDELRTLILLGGGSEYESRSEATFAAACGMLRAGLGEETVMSILMDDRFEISSHVLDQNNPLRAARRAVDSASREMRSSFVRTKGRIIPKHIGNIQLAVQKLNVTIRTNLLSGEIEIAGLPGFGPSLDDAAAIRIRKQIELRFDFLPPKDLLDDALRDLGKSNEFHPIRDYLDQLQWDAVLRLDDFLATYLGAESTALNRAFGSKFMIAAVRRIRRPGTKFDEMLVLEGEQGTGKSTALSILAVKPEWFVDDVPLGGGTREIMEAVEGTWIAEITELAALKKSGTERIKQVLSKTRDKSRKAYDRYATTLPRSFVMAGTTNDREYLTDTTGNRRFWPVKTGLIKLEKLSANRDQLWAEAAEREAVGEPIHLERSLWATAQALQGDRVAEDPWAETLRNKLGAHCGKIRSEHLFDLLGKPSERRSTFDSKRLATVMRDIGWEKSKQRFGGDRPTNCYIRRTKEEHDRGNLREIVTQVTRGPDGEREARVRYSDVGAPF